MDKLHECHEWHVDKLIIPRLPSLCIVFLQAGFTEFLRLTKDLFANPAEHATWVWASKTELPASLATGCDCLSLLEGCAQMKKSWLGDKLGFMHAFAWCKDIFHLLQPLPSGMAKDTETYETALDLQRGAAKAFQLTDCLAQCLGDSSAELLRSFTKRTPYLADGFLQKKMSGVWSHTSRASSTSYCAGQAPTARSSMCASWGAAHHRPST